MITKTVRPIIKDDGSSRSQQTDGMVVVSETEVIIRFLGIRVYKGIFKNPKAYGYDHWAEYQVKF